MSKSNETTPNVPTLRFGGFSDLWNKSTIEKNAKVYDGTHQTPIYTKSGVKFVSVENIKDLYSSDKYISIEDYNSDFKYVPEINDILMTRIGDIGTPALVTKSEPLAYYVSLALLKEIDLEPHFLYHYIQTAPFQKELWRRTLHVAFPKKINKNEIGDCAIFYPSTRCEQKKVALFLDGIEKRIKIQNKIISKYETLIKGIRHRIFGSICGEKQSSLGGFLEEYSEKNVANNLQSVAVGKYGIRKREEIYSKELSADYSKNKVIRKNTLIIGMGSTQIDIGILTTDDCYCVSPAYTTYRIKGINSFYLQEYLIELNPLLSVRYMITSARQGKAVNKEDLMKHLMTIHSESEQKEICKCFENLYSRLQIEKEMLSALQKQKAFLLQSMFI